MESKNYSTCGDLVNISVQVCASASSLRRRTSVGSEDVPIDEFIGEVDSEHYVNQSMNQQREVHSVSCYDLSAIGSPIQHIETQCYDMIGNNGTVAIQRCPDVSISLGSELSKRRKMKSRRRAGRSIRNDTERYDGHVHVNRDRSVETITRCDCEAIRGTSRESSKSRNGDVCSFMVDEIIDQCLCRHRSIINCTGAGTSDFLGYSAGTSIYSQEYSPLNAPASTEAVTLNECDPLLFENGGWETAWIDDFLLLRYSAANANVASKNIETNCLSLVEDIVILTNDVNKNFVYKGNSDDDDEQIEKGIINGGRVSKSSICNINYLFLQFNISGWLKKISQRFFPYKEGNWEISPSFSFQLTRSNLNLERSNHDLELQEQVDSLNTGFRDAHKISCRKKYRVLLLNIMMIVVTGAAIFNWVDLRTLLLRNGAYEEICSQKELERDGTCPLQIRALDDSFNVGIVFVKIAGVFTGSMLDAFGPRITGVWGLSLFFIGITCLSFNFVMCGLILLGCSMNPIYNSTISVANLFPNSRSSIICCLSAAGDLCVIDFFIIRLLSDYTITQVSARTWLLSYLLIIFPQLFIAMIILPRRSFILSHDVEGFDKNSPALPGYDVGVGTTSKIGDKYMSMNRWQSIMTLQFWMFLIFFISAFFKKVNYMRDVENFLKNLADTNYAAESLRPYMMAYSLILCSAAIFSIILGFISDKFGVAYGLLIVNTFSCLFSSLSLVPSLGIQILSFICFTIFKSFIISSVYCFVADVYGFKNIGFLTGTQQLVAGLFCLLNIPFQWYIIDGQWWLNHVTMLILSAASYIPLTYLFFMWRRNRVPYSKHNETTEDLDRS